MNGDICKELGCTACCQWRGIKDIIPKAPIKFKTQPYRKMRILQTNHLGDCIYLDRETGCTIHDKAPKRCCNFDCKSLMEHTKEELMGVPKHIKEAAIRRIEHENTNA